MHLGLEKLRFVGIHKKVGPALKCSAKGVEQSVVYIYSLLETRDLMYNDLKKCHKYRLTWIYPVESPTLYGGDEEKSSFLIEGGVQSPALSNGVYLKFREVRK